MVHIEQPKDIFFQLINGNVTLCSFAEPNYPFGLFNNNMKNDRYKLPLSLSLTLRWYIRNIYNVVVASHTRADRIKIFNSLQKQCRCLALLGIHSADVKKLEMFAIWIYERYPNDGWIEKYLYLFFVSYLNTKQLGMVTCLQTHHMVWRTNIKSLRFYFFGMCCLRFDWKYCPFLDLQMRMMGLLMMKSKVFYRFHHQLARNSGDSGVFWWNLNVQMIDSSNEVPDRFF